jgi:hypothetical protein
MKVCDGRGSDRDRTIRTILVVLSAAWILTGRDVLPKTTDLGVEFDPVMTPSLPD